MPHDYKYSVILHSGLQPTDVAFFERLCGKIVLSDGSRLLHFFCTDVDASHHVYLEMTTFKPSEDGLMKIRIPHGFVFLISDPIEEARPMGFAPE